MHLRTVALTIVFVGIVTFLVTGCTENSEPSAANQSALKGLPSSNPVFPPTYHPSHKEEPLSADAIIQLTNSVRLQHGLLPFNQNHLLNQIAEARVRDMFEKQYFDHVSPIGEGPSDTARRVGYDYKRLGENIATGPFTSSQKILDAWMQSPGHRNNIISVETDEIGVAWARGTMNGSEIVLAVQIFGKQASPVADVSPQNSCIPPSPDTPGQIDRQRSELAPLVKILGHLKEELDNDTMELELLRKDGRGRTDIGLPVSSYNAKVQRYNQLVGELQAKQEALKQILNEYNAKAEAYKTCSANN